MNTLIEQMRALGGNCALAADALESKDAEIERLTSALAQCRDVFAAPERGTATEIDWGAAMGEPESVPDFVKSSAQALQAKLDALQKQEPVAWIWEDINGDKQLNCYEPIGQPVYAAPVVAEPPTCTCPSGDGSLRWPCPQHPPEDVDAPEADCTPNHNCNGRMVHLPHGEQCDKCGIGGQP